MAEEISEQEEQTSQESLPETNTQEADASDEGATDDLEAEGEEAPDEDTPSDETENQAEAEAERPVSRASKRIRQLVAEKKAAEMALARERAMSQQATSQLEGVEPDGLDPNKYAESVARLAEQRADQRYYYNRELDAAAHKFPIVAQDELVGTRATALMNAGYSPMQAAELATLEYQESVKKATQEQKTRKAADQRLRTGATLTNAGRSQSKESGLFTRSEIAEMSTQEYAKHQDAIQKQLEKYGAESFNEA